jgi:hypothetical protein
MPFIENKIACAGLGEYSLYCDEKGKPSTTMQKKCFHKDFMRDFEKEVMVGDLKGRDVCKSTKLDPLVLYKGNTPKFGSRFVTHKKSKAAAASPEQVAEPEPAFEAVMEAELAAQPLPELIAEAAPEIAAQPTPTRVAEALPELTAPEVNAVVAMYNTSKSKSKSLSKSKSQSKSKSKSKSRTRSPFQQISPARLTRRKIEAQHIANAAITRKVLRKFKEKRERLRIADEADELALRQLEQRAVRFNENVQALGTKYQHLAEAIDVPVQVPVQPVPAPIQPKPIHVPSKSKVMPVESKPKQYLTQPIERKALSQVVKLNRTAQLRLVKQSMRKALTRPVGGATTRKWHHKRQ